MAGPENDPVKQNPQAGKEAAPSAPATKYVGTPAVGTSKAAAAGGIAAVGPGQLRGRPAPPSSRVDRHHGISGRMVPCLLPLFPAANAVRAAYLIQDRVPVGLRAGR